MRSSKRKPPPGPWSAFIAEHKTGAFWVSLGSTILGVVFAFLVYRLMAPEDAVKDQVASLICFGLISGAFPIIGFCVYGYVKQAKKQRDDAVAALFNERARRAHYIKFKLQMAAHDTRELGSAVGGGGALNALDCFRQLGDDLIDGITYSQFREYVTQKLSFPNLARLPSTLSAEQRQLVQAAVEGIDTIYNGLLQSGVVIQEDFNAHEWGLKATEIGAWMIRNPLASPCTDYGL